MRFRGEVLFPWCASKYPYAYGIGFVQYSIQMALHRIY